MSARVAAGWWTIVVCALSCLCCPGTASAKATYPAERPIQMVVPFAPGGGTDILARLVGEKLGRQLGQTVVIDNKPGANGLIAISVVERAAPDGYTLMFGSSSTHVLAPLMAPATQPIDHVRKQFALVGMVAETPLVFAVAAASEAKDFGQLARLAHDRAVTYGTFGAGSSPHILGQLIAAKIGAPLVHVAYKGSAPAVTDLIGGHIDSVFLTVAAVRAHIEGHEVRPLAVTGSHRVQTLPDVPTFGQLGIGGLENSGWFALFAPAGTPVSVLARLRTELDKVMRLPAVRAELKELGLESSGDDRGRDEQLWDQTIEDMRHVLVQINPPAK